MVEWWSGGVVEWWSGGVVEWWSGGVVKWWSGGVVEWWNGGVVEWWSGGVVGGGGGEAPAAVPRTVSLGVVPRGPHAGSAEGVLRLTSARVRRISSHT